MMNRKLVFLLKGWMHMRKHLLLGLYVTKYLPCNYQARKEQIDEIRMKLIGLIFYDATLVDFHVPEMFRRALENTSHKIL